jgi:DNA-binding response OmpR family regulator
MPEMSGFEVMDMINRDRTLQDIPVIFVTSHASEELIVKAVEHGAVNYIIKPYKADILRARIENVLKSPK